ncbi:hypothetical protein [Flavobacterium sp.]|uniref:hypothetical protein n=1 Tax=Flavobacterium sp. TaxID=239 RepID=UPI00374FEEBE
MNQPQNLVFTDNEVEVSDRIKKGTTLFFTCKQNALQFANTIRTYVYECFDSKGASAGYCVPK